MKNKLLKNLLVLSSIFIVGCNNQTTSNNSTSNQDTSSSSKDSSTSIDKESSSSNTITTTSESTTSETTSSSEQSSIKKEELIQDYHLHFSDPKLIKVGEQGDDIYLKANFQDEGLLISMIGFGDFIDSEYIKIIIHTSENNSSGWNIQSDDVTFLINKNKANYKTNITKFWDYVNFGNDSSCKNTPKFTQLDGYFTLTMLIDYTEIPNYDKYKNVSMFAMEFNNGAIYDGIDYNNGMLIDGVSHGDPASQTSYYVIQEKSLPNDQQELVKDYKYQFSIGSDNIYAKFTRKTSSLLLEMISFSTFDKDDYIRFVVHTNEINNSSWGLSKDDVSFSIYKNVCYYQTNKVNFWDNEANQFHGKDTSINNPLYQENEKYFTLSIEFEYSEFSLEKNILQTTPLRGILVEFTPSIANNGFKQDGNTLGDIANQENYFTF